MAKKKRSVIDKMGGSFIANLNRIQGQCGEIKFGSDKALEFDSVTKTGIGSDFENKKGEKFEIKTNTSRPTKLQKEGIKKGKVKLIRYYTK